MREKLLTTREVSQILGIPEKDIIDLANANLLPHFKIADQFLRFRKEDILKVKENIRRKYNLPRKKSTFIERLKEFIYFNDFYILSAIIIFILLFLIFKNYR
ncbi:MAG: helix-turn-helix domain-containing protein [Candidatus Omnitrophica bacterium]|nr:helix-turn-helix domain-containing protein [Candidatus Omnitrophota bacterium]